MTAVTSGNNVSVNGMPRHVLDLRRVVDEGDDGDGVAAVPVEGMARVEGDEPPSLAGLRALFDEVGEAAVVANGESGVTVTGELEAEEEAATTNESRPSRATRAPAWLEDYVVG